MVFKNNFITMDIETILINNIHTPYLIAFYTGTKYESFIIENNPVNIPNIELDNIILNMIKNCIEKLCQYIYLTNKPNYKNKF